MCLISNVQSVNRSLNCEQAIEAEDEYVSELVDKREEVEEEEEEQKQILTKKFDHVLVHGITTREIG